MHLLIALMSEHQVVWCAQRRNTGTLILIILVARGSRSRINKFINEHVFELTNFLMVLNLLVEGHTRIVLIVNHAREFLGGTIKFLSRILLGVRKALQEFNLLVWLFFLLIRFALLGQCIGCSFASELAFDRFLFIWSISKMIYHQSDVIIELGRLLLVTWWSQIICGWCSSMQLESKRLMGILLACLFLSTVLLTLWANIFSFFSIFR